MPHRVQLYLIKKLHQITAYRHYQLLSLLLYLIKKLHQITARTNITLYTESYILLRNYIKSQLSSS